jgi:phosphatidylinositol alpha-1,6-mannosyltransferase
MTNHAQRHARRRAQEATAGGEAPGHAGPVLLLAPSQGRGGGIERYVATVQSAFRDRGVVCQRLDLPRSGPAGYRTLLAAASAALAGQADAARVVVAHRALLPVAVLLSRIRQVRGISVVCHGIEAWGARTNLRWQLESRMMRSSGVRLVAVSSFTAGSLFPGGRHATILPPGLARDWFDELARAAAIDRGQRAGLEVMTAFRLGAWRDKGLPQLTAAIAALRCTDVRLTVCGSGKPPDDLLAHASALPWCSLRPGLADHDLAAQFAASDLFVLASRTRHGRRPCGEGFGLVLLEAQVAGTAVVGPAHGGSPDAYLDGVTGVSPRDESAAALAQALRGLVSQPARLREMGSLGAQWAGKRFAPDRYAGLVVDRLL